MIALEVDFQKQKLKGFTLVEFQWKSKSKAKPDLKQIQKQNKSKQKQIQNKPKQKQIQNKSKNKSKIKVQKLGVDFQSFTNFILSKTLMSV